MTPMLLFGLLEIAFLVMLAAATIIAVVHDVKAMKNKKKDEEQK